MGDTKTKVIRTNPKLWEKVKKKVTTGSKGGNPGQWSARKAQLSVALYKKRGGKYGKNSAKPKNTSLGKWSRQKWGTKSGKNSVVGKKATGERYLPKKARNTLSDKEYKKTSAKKRRDTKKGIQHSRQQKKISKKTSPYTRTKRRTKRRTYKMNTKSKTNEIILKTIKKSDKKGKKWMANFEKNGKKIVRHFGYKSNKDTKNDYTLHKDRERRNVYVWRHMKDTRTNDPTRAGFLSLYVLWNLPSRKSSIEDFRKRLKNYSKTGEFKKKIKGYKKPPNAKTEYQSYKI